MSDLNFPKGPSFPAGMPRLAWPEAPLALLCKDHAGHWQLLIRGGCEGSSGDKAQPMVPERPEFKSLLQAWDDTFLIYTVVVWIERGDMCLTPNTESVPE